MVLLWCCVLSSSLANFPPSRPLGSCTSFRLYRGHIIARVPPTGGNCNGTSKAYDHFESAIPFKKLFNAASECI